MRLVYVEWVDSNGAAGWHQYDDMLATVTKGMLCKSVGWLLLDGHDRIALVPNLAETGSVADATTIPKETSSRTPLRISAVSTKNRPLSWAFGWPSGLRSQVTVGYYGDEPVNESWG
jgi:hypothetical protein